MLLSAMPPRACVKSIYTRPTKVQTRSMTKQKEAKDIDDQDAFECMCQATLANAVPLNTDLTTKIWGLRYSDHIATHGNFLFVEPLTDIESSEHSSCSEAAYLFEQARKDEGAAYLLQRAAERNTSGNDVRAWQFQTKKWPRGLLDDCRPCARSSDYIGRHRMDMPRRDRKRYYAKSYPSQGIREMGDLD
jgi:hypothetical protein